MKNIQIQKSNSSEKETITIEKNMVIIGANGSGKTRLGAMLEQINTPTKRISAQRYLTLRELVEKQDVETADNQLKNIYKNQPSNSPQNDYQQVLILLFAQESRRDSEYVASSRESRGRVEIPQSIKEKVIDCWISIFPYRALKLEKDRVRADDFSGQEMSDGEKVGLYLISQILLAEKDCILIIDEPELHLHKALMTRLWNKLEEYRSDCTFIYITHDLDFAVSKSSSKLIWVQSYKDNLWIWKEIDPNNIIPENLYLEILGSRKSILFVEGEKGSLDIQIYQLFYDNFTVIPRGSCGEVIESVKGLKKNPNLHDKKVYGLIDRDFHSEEKIKSWHKKGIFSIKLNKVENLFLIPEIIEMVCNHLSKPEEKEKIISKIKENYKKNKKKIFFTASKDRQHRHLGEKFGLVKNKKNYDNFKSVIFSELDSLFVSDLPDNNSEIIEILKVYPYKGFVREIQGMVGLSKNEYINLVLSFLSSSDKRKKIIKILKFYLPRIN
ncbi:MAG: AAA family ATPase [Patescibacteria group bacterium]|nr:AAA family ATPase [Patescibacteria group bacterium]MDD5534865.1 AAA family ATPase [Patescibacteria group bacterium]